MRRNQKAAEDRDVESGIALVSDIADLFNDKRISRVDGMGACICVALNAAQEIGLTLEQFLQIVSHMWFEERPS